MQLDFNQNNINSREKLLEYWEPAEKPIWRQLYLLNQKGGMVHMLHKFIECTVLHKIMHLKPRYMYLSCTSFCISQPLFPCLCNFNTSIFVFQCVGELTTTLFVDCLKNTCPWTLLSVNCLGSLFNKNLHFIFDSELKVDPVQL